MIGVFLELRIVRLWMSWALFWFCGWKVMVDGDLGLGKESGGGEFYLYR